MTKLYGIRNCDSCRLATRWLDENGVDYDFIDVRADGIDEATLERWQELLGWDKLVNKRSITWRKVPAFDREDLDATKARQLIINHPTIMKRPVLEADGQVILGFDKYAYADLGLS